VLLKQMSRELAFLSCLNSNNCIND
jgi:hypothetical protein